MLKKISRCVAGRPPLELSKKKQQSKEGKEEERKENWKPEKTLKYAIPSLSIYVIAITILSSAFRSGSSVSSASFYLMKSNHSVRYLVCKGSKASVSQISSPPLSLTNILVSRRFHFYHPNIHRLILPLLHLFTYSKRS